VYTEAVPAIPGAAVIRNAIVIHPKDNVATAAVDIPAGADVVGSPRPVAAREPIPYAHKVAIVPIPEGAEIVKYGEPIGRATVAIAPGGLVHSHNVGPLER
jgi:altronate dehydratase